MAITFVSSSGASVENQSSTTYSVAIPVAQTAGDLIAVGIWTSGLTQAISSVSDSNGNPYNAVYTKNASAAAGGQNALYVCTHAKTASASANTVTVKFGASQATASVAICTFNSDDGFGYLDVPAGEATGNSTTATRSLTTINANALVLGFITGGTSKITAVTTGSTPGITPTNGVTLAYAIRTTAGSQALAATVAATNRWVDGTCSILKTAPAGIPANLIQNISPGAQVIGSPAGTTTAAYISIDNTPSGNCLVLFVATPYVSGLTVTISDNKTNTWSSAGTPAVNSGSGGEFGNVYAFVALNVASGTNYITVTYNSSLQYHGYAMLHLQNIATSSAIDGYSQSTSTSGSNVQAGNVANSTNNDLIIHYGMDTSGGGATETDFSPGPGFTLLDGDLNCGQFIQIYAQGTAATVNPRVVASGAGGTFSTIAFGLKTASSGSDPFASIIGVRHRKSQALPSAGLKDVNFPCQGNLLVVGTAYDAPDHGTPTFTDNYNNSYTACANVSGYPQVFYATNARTGPDLRINIAWASGSGVNQVLLYDVVNAATANVLDTTATGTNHTSGYCYQSIVNPANTTMTHMPDFTPSAANELVFAWMGNNTGPCTGITSPSGAVEDFVYYLGETDTDYLQNSDGYAHFYATSTSSQNWTWTMANASSETSVSAVVAFKQTSGGSISLGTATLQAALGIASPHIVQLIKATMQSALGITSATPRLSIASTLQSKFGITNAKASALIKATLQAAFGVRNPSLLVNSVAHLQFSEGITSASAVQVMRGGNLQFHEGIFPAPVFTSGNLTAALQANFGISQANVALLIRAGLVANFGISPGPHVIAPMASTLAAALGISPGPHIVNAIAAHIQATFGITPSPAIMELIKANLVADFGITYAQVTPLIQGSIVAHFGIRPAPSLSGGTIVTPKGVFIFSDAYGVHRVVTSE